MSPKQNINLKENHGILADTWIAGTNSKTLRSIFKHNDLETIDITAICETISSAIRIQTRESESLEGNLWHSMKFRVVSHLCFGMIRIYNQQVQNLLVQTRRFFERSSFKKGTILSQRCINLCIASKTHRVHQNEGTFVAGYNKLIETEHSPMMDNKRRAIFSTVLENVPSIPKGSLNGAQSFEISEFSITEVNVGSGIPELDENLDFGYAALEEKVLVNDIFGITSDLESTRKLLKILILSGSNSQIKEDDFVNTKPKEKSLSNGKNTFNDDQSSIEHFRSFDSSNLKNCPPESMQFGNSDNLKILHIDTEGQSSGVDEQIPPTTLKDLARCSKGIHFIVKRPNNHRTNRCRKTLTFDEFVKLTDKELRCSWDQYEEKQCLSRQEIKVVQKNKYGNGFELHLAPSRKSAIKFNCVKTTKYSRFRNSSEHVNIINEIVVNSIDKQQSVELTTKCEDTFLTSLKRRKSKSTNNIIIHTTAENAELKYGKRVCLGTNQIFRLITNNHKRISPGHSIIITLLNTLQESRTESIDAKIFIFNAIDRKGAALTFHALLELTTSKFVVMTKDEKTSEIEKIFLGPSFENMFSFNGFEISFSKRL